MNAEIFAALNVEKTNQKSNSNQKSGKENIDISKILGARFGILSLSKFVSGFKIAADDAFGKQMQQLQDNFKMSFDDDDDKKKDYEIQNMILTSKPAQIQKEQVQEKEIKKEQLTSKVEIRQDDTKNNQDKNHIIKEDNKGKDENINLAVFAGEMHRLANDFSKVKDMKDLKQFAKKAMNFLKKAEKFLNNNNLTKSEDATKNFAIQFKAVKVKINQINQKVQDNKNLNTQQITDLKKDLHQLLKDFQNYLESLRSKKLNHKNQEANNQTEEIQNKAVEDLKDSGNSQIENNRFNNVKQNKIKHHNVKNAADNNKNLQSEIEFLKNNIEIEKQQKNIETEFSKHIKQIKDIAGNVKINSLNNNEKNVNLYEQYFNLADVKNFDKNIIGKTSNNTNNVKGIENASSVKNVKADVQLNNNSLQNNNSDNANKAENKNIKKQAPHKHINQNNILDQIVEKAKAVIQQGKAEITIQLKPEHLGKVEIKLMTNEKGQMIGRIVVDNVEVKTVLLNNLNNLHQQLNDLGLAVMSFEVNVGNENNNENEDIFEQFRNEEINKAENDSSIEEDSDYTYIDGLTTVDYKA